MRRVVIALIAIFLAARMAWAAAAASINVTSDGWTIAVDGERATLSITRDNLGPILKEIRLNVEDEGRLRRLTGWSVEKKGENGLKIRTTEPSTVWLFELSAEALKISTTTAEGVLTATAPAPSSRVVARLLDPQGMPVNWTLTAEVKMGFGGTEASTPSFLPRRNPEVMYFALGQVASSNLHSLFDRKTDTALDFPEQTMLQRRRQDADLLEVTIPVSGNTWMRVVPDYFTKTLGVPNYVPFDDHYFRRAPMVWDSWSSYYEQVREEDVIRNADWIAAHLKAYGYQYVQIDDGYDRGKSNEHYWIENWNKERFPHGPKWLTDYIKSKGLRAGLWLVPSAYAGAVEEHPEWYLRYKKDGAIIRDYSTPTLDATNPQVIEFLKKEFTILDDWGFEYYKFDGEHDFLKYVPGVDLDKIANKSVDPIVAYRNRLKAIRETVGPHRFIEGCPAGTPLDGIGYFNSYYTGEDPYNSWQGMYVVFSSINANSFLNHLAVYVMPGEMDVEPPMSVQVAIKRRPSIVVETARQREEPMRGFGTTLAEARTVVSFVALSGVVYSLGSLLPELPKERLELLKMTLPTMPILPIDLFSRGTDMPLWSLFKQTTPDEFIHHYPETLDLKVNAPSGVYDVAGLINWRSWTTTRTLAFAETLGLSPKVAYVVFDFWGQKLLGVFRERMNVTIDPHDTRVLLIHPLLNRPQLVGTSRHITGAYSITDLAWDASRHRLHGVSETVAGETYTLWFYLPRDVQVSQARARTKGKTPVPLQDELSGNLLKISFPGQPEAVNWEVDFAGQFSR